MNLGFQAGSKVKVTMFDYIKELLEESHGMIKKGYGTTLAANNLSTMSKERIKLHIKITVKFHQLVAKFLFLSKRARPDIFTALTYLTTRILSPTEIGLKL